MINEKPAIYYFSILYFHILRHSIKQDRRTILQMGWILYFLCLSLSHLVPNEKEYTVEGKNVPQRGAHSYLLE